VRDFATGLREFPRCLSLPTPPPIAKSAPTFGAGWAKARRDSGDHALAESLKIHGGLCLARVAPLLLESRRVLIVLRAIVLSIVLLFVAGRTVPLLCNVWCEPQAAAASGCHHEDNGGSTSVASDDSCEDSIQGNAVILRESLTRASTDGLGNVIAVAHYQLAVADASLRARRNERPAPTGLKRPLTTPLRI
jgi:hypothetical protein